jgi:hypothetical protein
MIPLLIAVEQMLMGSNALERHFGIEESKYVRENRCLVYR